MRGVYGCASAPVVGCGLFLLAFFFLIFLATALHNRVHP